MLSALESMELIRYTSYRSYNQRLHSKSPKYCINYWVRLHELILYSRLRRHERYIIIYIWMITQHKVPNIDGTMGKKTKTSKLRETVRYSVSNKQKPSTVPSRICNNCVLATFVQLVGKISDRHRKCWNHKIQIWAWQISRTNSWWAKKCPTMPPQQETTASSTSCIILGLKEFTRGV